MLYIVGTPIGNLKDFSLRAAEIIVSADVLLAEDTRSALVLVEHAKQMLQNCSYQVSPDEKKHEEVNCIVPKIISYYQKVEFEKLPHVIQLLENGVNVALISEAGMPLISDPGYLLIHEARKRALPVTVIPGPSSVDTALSAAGMKFDHFYFAGFLPKKQNELQGVMEKLHSVAHLMGSKTDIVFVAFESPQRVKNTLNLLYAHYPSIHITLCRELTKKFEEILQQPTPQEYKGEIVLLLSF